MSECQWCDGGSYCPNTKREKQIQQDWADLRAESKSKDDQIAALEAKKKEAQTRHLREQEKNGHYINEIAALSTMVEEADRCKYAWEWGVGCSHEDNSRCKCPDRNQAMRDAWAKYDKLRAASPLKVLAEVRAKVWEAAAYIARDNNDFCHDNYIQQAAALRSGKPQK